MYIQGDPWGFGICLIHVFFSCLRRAQDEHEKPQNGVLFKPSQLKIHPAGFRCFCALLLGHRAGSVGFEGQLLTPNTFLVRCI